MKQELQTLDSHFYLQLHCFSSLALWHKDGLPPNRSLFIIFDLWENLWAGKLDNVEIQCLTSHIFKSKILFFNSNQLSLIFLHPSVLFFCLGFFFFLFFMQLHWSLFIHVLSQNWTVFLLKLLPLAFHVFNCKSIYFTLYLLIFCCLSK